MISWPQWPEITLWPLRAGPVVEVRGEVDVPHEARVRADSVWSELTATNPRLFDGPILSLAEFDPATGRLQCRRSSYKWLAVGATIDTGVTLVAVNGIVTATDARGREHLLLARRAPGTWIYGGQWELSPAGGVDPPERDGVLPTAHLIDQLRRELLEEAGIDEPAVAAQPVSFYRDIQARSFNIILRVHLPRPLEQVRAAVHATHWDSDATRWVRFDDLPGFLATHPAIHAAWAIFAWLSGDPRASKHGQ